MRVPFSETERTKGPPATTTRLCPGVGEIRAVPNGCGGKELLSYTRAACKIVVSVVAIHIYIYRWLVRWESDQKLCIHTGVCVSVREFGDA